MLGEILGPEFGTLPPMLHKLTRAWLVLSALVIAAAFATPALAMGTYRLAGTEIQETAGGTWRIRLTIDLPQPPPIAHVPMKFMFTKLTVYERALTDNSKDPVMNRIPIQNSPPSIERLDVDFADGTGKRFKKTLYDFSLTRTRSFEAGEYKMEIQMSDGTPIGGPTNIILRGDNPVVDRRRPGFAAAAKKEDAGAKQNHEAALPTSTEVAPVGTAPPFVAPEAFNKTEEEEIKTKPGGCGCSIPGMGGSSQALVALASMLVLGLGVVSRRRK